MHTRGIVLALSAVGLLSGDVAAQPPAQSFERLSSEVAPGTAVVVKGDDGRSVNGRITALTGDRIEIRRRRWIFRTEQLSFPESSVRRIEEQDPTWNGTLLGLGAGVLAAWVDCRTSHDPDDWSCLAMMGLAPGAGAIIGVAIDRATRRPLYIPSGSGVPLGSTRRAPLAITATIRF